MANLIRRSRESRELARERGPESYWDPFRMMQAMLNWDPFRTEPISGLGGEFVPSIDVRETKDSYVFKCDLPGVKEEDLEISLTGSVLRITGQREEERREEGEQLHAVERSYGYFTRSFTLPDGADVEHVKAELKDGVLTLHVPKRPEVQPKRITVTGKGKGSEAKA